MDNRIRNQLNIIGHNLYLGRKCKGLTMQEVSELTGLCRQTISSVESGSGKIGIETYLLVANAVGVDLTAVVAPQTYRRARRPIAVMDRYHGTTEDGTAFTVVVNKKGTYVIFQYDGMEYSKQYFPSSYELELENMDLVDYNLRCYVQDCVSALELEKAKQTLRGSIALTKAPDAINADCMTNEQLRVKLQKGIDDAEAGRVQDAAPAFSKFRETH